MLWHKTWGSPKNPLLIFLHGFMGTYEDFLPLINFLKSQFYCLALDLPCHGNASNILPQSISAFEDFILDTIEPYAQDEVTLIGYSMGGRIALNLSEKIPLSTLVLISSKVKPLLKKQREERLLTDKLLSRELQTKPFNHFLKKWYELDLFQTLIKKESLFKDMLKRRKSQNPKSLSHALELLSNSHYFSSYDSFKQASFPILYCAGDQDEKYIKELYSLTYEKKEMWQLVVSNASHCVHLEKPHIIAKTFKTFYRYYYDRLERRAPV